MKGFKIHEDKEIADCLSAKESKIQVNCMPSLYLAIEHGSSSTVISLAIQQSRWKKGSFSTSIRSDQA